MVTKKLLINQEEEEPSQTGTFTVYDVFSGSTAKSSSIFSNIPKIIRNYTYGQLAHKCCLIQRCGQHDLANDHKLPGTM
jgi:hypothetical protein